MIRFRVPGASALVTSLAEGTSVMVPRSNLDMSPAWSRVLKEGRRQIYVSENVDVRPKPRANQPKGKKPGGIVGTSAGGSIQAVKTKG